MLTIQPGLAHNTNRNLAFGRSELQRYAEDADYVDYEEINDSFPSDSFNYENEKREAKQELDLWKQTKANIDSITKATDSVPIVKKGTTVLSGLTMVAIGWGGLRWGSIGTLEVLAKIMKTDAAKSVKGFITNSGEFISKKFGSLKKFISETDTYKAAERKAGDLNSSFLKSSLGKKYTQIKTAITSHPVYKDTINFKNRAVNYIKDINYNRVFVETMGVAGGGTAAVNALGGKAIDGTKQNVEIDEEGNYRVDGEYYDAA